MMDYPPTPSTIFRPAETLFCRQEAVWRTADKSICRYSCAEFADRARRLAQVLLDLGVSPGDRVATLGWNHGPHLEAYFGIPLMGGVLHTLNLRLHPDELAYIINHAEDRFLILDDCLLPVYEKVRGQVRPERIIVVPTGGGPTPAGFENYEDFLAQAPRDYAPPQLDENQAAAMCYTSGTTGVPKGVVYSHRSLVLHSFCAALPDHFCMSQSSAVLPVVPMFHANAWGI